MTDLINRLESADGADRELFNEVFEHLGLPTYTGRSDDLHTKVEPMLLACAWESAALALVGECGQVVRYISWHRFEGRPEVVHATVGPSHFESRVGHHKSPAIAILIALLKAKD